MPTSPLDSPLLQGKLEKLSRQIKGSKSTFVHLLGSIGVMALFTSKQPEVTVPDNVTTWEWLFESKDTPPLHLAVDKPLGAFIDAESGQRLDWAEVKSKSTALSTCLTQHYNLRSDDTVTVFSGNSIWYPLCLFASLRAGARINGASPACSLDEMVYALRTAKTKILFTVPASLERAVAASEQVGIPRGNVILLHGAAAGFQNIHDLIRQGSADPPQQAYQIPPGMTNRQLCGFLNFSSGTTGLPKAVMISHYNVIAQCYQSRQIQVDTDRLKILAIMPLYHITGTWRFCCYPIFCNADAIMLPSFTMQGMLQAIVKYRIEELVLVPPILLRLARDPMVDDFDLSHVKRWTSGAAPLSPQLLQSLEKRFPWTGFRQGYGATEAAVMAAHPPTHCEWKYGVSVGMLLANTVAKVINPITGEQLGVGQTGELLVKGPQVATMGYFNNPQATAETFDADGFYRTGDCGYCDAEGLFYIQDRFKEMIKVKGHQVPPAELEDLLLGHEVVDDCAVVSLPDEYAGEVPKAYIVLKSGIPSTQEVGEMLLEYVRQKKSRYKWLAEIEFTDKIPKSPAGKLLRRVLRDQERERQTKVGEQPGTVHTGLRVKAGESKKQALVSVMSVTSVESRQPVVTWNSVYRTAGVSLVRAGLLTLLGFVKGWTLKLSECLRRLRGTRSHSEWA